MWLEAILFFDRNLQPRQKHNIVMAVHTTALSYGAMSLKFQRLTDTSRYKVDTGCFEKFEQRSDDVQV